MDYYQVVVGMRGIDPSYFWKEMSSDEVSAIFKAQTEIDRGEMEKTRIISYWAASGMSKMPEMKDWWSLPWDSEADTKKPKTKHKPSKKRMDAIIDKINGNKL